MSAPTVERWRDLPRTVWALGFVSLFMDTSSEMIHAFLPAFLVTTLGASAVTVGVIEGIAEATAAITRVFSGAISDASKRRKGLALWGYGLAALTKPVFALAATPLAVLSARFLDRVGKGIRGAPRDALVADVTPPAAWGAAYGLRQALDTVGAFSGPLLGMLLLHLFGGDLRLVFGVAVIPAFVAVGLLALRVEEPERAPSAPRVGRPIGWSHIGELSSAFWAIVAIGAVFTLARFSEAFLVLRALQVGLPLALVPVVMIAMNLAYLAAAAPAGRLSDGMDRRRLLALGLVALIAANVVLGLWGSVTGTLLGAALWGLHMALSQGLLAALVADTAPESLRGTAFGVFHLASGAALLCASLVAGILWEQLGAQATFATGAAFTTLALAGLITLIRRNPQKRSAKG